MSDQAFKQSTEYKAFRMGVFWVLSLLARDWPMVAACMVHKLPEEFLKEGYDERIRNTAGLG